MPRGLKPGAWHRCREIVKWCRWGECQCGLLSGHTYPDHVCPHGFVKKGRRSIEGSRTGTPA